MVMTTEQNALWNSITDFEFDDDTSQQTFTDRLVRENGWKYKYVVRVIEEYKKFMFLVCLYNQPLTPSDQVDQVWHLHLIYTHSYWQEFCGNILKKEIHHGPTKGGTKESSKFTDWYSRTLELYKTVFQETPPADIWPEGEKRFREINFLRVDKDRNWIIKKPFS
jgi:hypothetical protein